MKSFRLLTTTLQRFPDAFGKREHDICCCAMTSTNVLYLGKVASAIDVQSAIDEACSFLLR